jgi:hypothetical protein
MLTDEGRFMFRMRRSREREEAFPIRKRIAMELQLPLLPHNANGVPMNRPNRAKYPAK